MKAEGYEKVVDLAKEQIEDLKFHRDYNVDTDEDVRTEDDSFQFFLSQLEIYVNEGSITQAEADEAKKILDDCTVSLMEAYKAVARIFENKPLRKIALTFGEIYREFLQVSGIPIENIDNYRPCRSTFGVPDIPEAILIWLKDGGKIIYIAKKEKGVAKND